MTTTYDAVIPAQRETEAPPIPASVDGEPPKLTHDQLACTHAETLATPRREYSIAAKAAVPQMDLLYGRAATLEKFLVLEIVARVPYQTWETASYKRITRGPPQRSGWRGASGTACASSAPSRTTSSGTC